LFSKLALEECQRRELQEAISHYQLLPARRLLEHSIRTSFYIDTTLVHLFEPYAWLNRRIAKEAIEKEREGYRVASRVISMASWVRDSLEHYYGLPPERIFTVLPGANLPEKEVKAKLEETGPSIAPDRFTRDRPMRIGYTGKDWKRKGLPRLVDAVEILNRMGIPSEVVVIGNLPEQYRTRPCVRAAGFIDKSREATRFIDIAGGCDVGCAPSHEEPMGIAPLEYLRLGIPVLCTAAGGLKDVCAAAGAASVLLSKDATAEEIAAEFESVSRDGDRLRSMQAAAWKRKDHFSWERTVRELQRIWEPASRQSSEPPAPSTMQTQSVG